MNSASLIVKPEKAGTFFNRHPWVLDKSLYRPSAPPEDGQVVDLVTTQGEFIARGVYNSASRIRARLYTFVDEPIDENFWRRRIERAVELRNRLKRNEPNEAARLVYSEADGLSGLIVDRYANDLVVQITALAASRRLDTIVATLKELLNPDRIWLRINEGAARAEGISQRDELLWGDTPVGPIVYYEHGLEYAIDLAEGQKTGAYLDQRDNRKAAASMIDGRRTLDICCYNGGFSLSAASLGGASEVIGVDSSSKALRHAADNAARNNLQNVQFTEGNCFDALASLAKEGQQFGAVILDPPRFAGARREIDSALRAYHRLNRLAVDVLAPDGLLVTCSCSGHVSREAFTRMLGGVAHKTRRDIQVLASHGASRDHPTLLSCPETEYLKCLFCRVL